MLDRRLRVESESAVSRYTVHRGHLGWSTRNGAQGQGTDVERGRVKSWDEIAQENWEEESANCLPDE